MTIEERKQKLKELIVRIERKRESEVRNTNASGNLMEFQTTRTEMVKELLDEVFVISEMMDEVFVISAQHIKDNPDLFNTETPEEKYESLFMAIAHILDNENEEFASFLSRYIVNNLEQADRVLAEVEV